MNCQKPPVTGYMDNPMPVPLKWGMRKGAQMYYNILQSSIDGRWAAGERIRGNTAGISTWGEIPLAYSTTKNVGNKCMTKTKEF